MKELHLTNWIYPALVDDVLYPQLRKLKWRAIFSRGKGKAVGILSTTKIGKNQISLANYIFGLTKEEIDHIDRNPLNNTLLNLRIATRQQNVCNTRGSFQFLIGVYPNGHHYEARLICEGKMYSKTFPTAIEAAKFRDELAKKHHGDFAVLNFPSE